MEGMKPEADPLIFVMDLWTSKQVPEIWDRCAQTGWGSSGFSHEILELAMFNSSSTWVRPPVGVRPDLLRS